MGKPRTKPVGIAKWIADEAEMQEAGVKTMAGIRRFAGECLDGANSWDIVGRCAVLGTDGKVYEGYVTFVLEEAPPARSKELLEELAQNEGEEET
jgi:hypothetical protein